MRWMGVLGLAVLLAACVGGPDPVMRRGQPPLYPTETPELRAMINHYAGYYDVPAALIHRLIDRESDYRPDLRAGPYYGLLQMLPETARTMGHRGPASELLDPDQNLRWGVKYLRGAYLLSQGDFDGAIMRYARGYYY